MPQYKRLRALFNTLCLLFLSQWVIGQPAPDASQQFQLTSTQNQREIILHWNIAKDHFLYQERIHWQSTPNQPEFQQIVWPKTHSHQDRLGMMHQIYEHELELHLPLPKTTKPVELTVYYQGCSLKGVCYTPQQTKFLIQSQQTSYTKLIIELLSFLGIGILMAFTPCVLPMLPIMTRIVVGQSNNQTSKQTFGLALAYIVGMASSYALVGGFIALIGKNLFILMQQNWIMWLFACIFIYFGLATLGILEIKLPKQFQQKTLNYRASLSPGRYLTALIMGGLSLLVLSPCVTAPLLGALTYITQMGQVWRGSLALFLLGIGMGIPLMLFVISAGHWLPKAGSWMDNMKQILAIMLFSIATLLISRTLSAPYQTFIWLAPMGAALWFCLPKARHPRHFLFIRSVLSFIIALYMILFTLTSFHVKCFPWLSQEKSIKHQHHVIDNEKDLKRLLAKTPKQPIMLYFSAKWCTTCNYLDNKVWNNPDLSPLFKKIKLIKIDLSNNLPEQQHLMQQYQVVAPPTVILLEPRLKAARCRLLGEEITITHLQQWSNIVSNRSITNTCK